MMIKVDSTEGVKVLCTVGAGSQDDEVGRLYDPGCHP